jgi:hypothetical protein
LSPNVTPDHCNWMPAVVRYIREELPLSSRSRISIAISIKPPVVFSLHCYKYYLMKEGDFPVLIQNLFSTPCAQGMKKSYFFCLWRKTPILAFRFWSSSRCFPVLLATGARSDTAL